MADFHLNERNVVELGSGPPMVFAHGFPLDHSMWDAQIEEFGKTHHVIAPDLRGFGESESVDVVSHMWHFADEIALILEQGLNVQEPVTFCGLSMGGYIALEFWKRHPDKVKTLILCDTKAAADSDDAKHTREENAQRVMREGPGFLADAMPEKLFSKKTLRENPEVVEQTQAVMRATSPIGIASALRGMATREDFTDHLAQISVPTLLICGEDDIITPVTEMQSMANRIPNSRLAVIPGAGHMAPLEQPEAVNQVIREFLGAEK
ncbi:MAG: alpha/beta fold hydrolase [Planctomycetaceae bacterium]|nr:alpha/beta fold hydrolase [Planctomycetaceae bacterium]